MTRVSAAELLAEERHRIENEWLPMVQEGTLGLATVGEMVNLYRKYEPCLALSDGQDLLPYVLSPP